MSDERTPFARLGIPPALEARLGPDAPAQALSAMARGLLPMAPDVQLAVLYVLATRDDEALREACFETLNKLPKKLLIDHIGLKTHPKVVELVATFRDPDPELDERLSMLRTANDRTVALIAARAGPSLCELLSRNQERLLVTPELFVALHANPACSDADIARAEAFLRMQEAMPAVPAKRPFLVGGDEFVAIDAAAGPAAAPAAPKAPAPAPAAAKPPPKPPAAAPSAAPAALDLMAEIEAALRGERSPHLIKAQEQKLEMFDLGRVQAGQGFKAEGMGGFSFDFSDEIDSFSWDLTGETEDLAAEERGALNLSIEQKIKGMSVGQKIKLAYLGNKEARSHLLRDRNKMVAGAVVKSGRMTEQEVAAAAGNKNLDGEVIREIAANTEWTRKYPVKVSLVNNPKTPVAQAVALVGTLQKKDLMMLTRNRNVPSVVTEAAVRLFRQKYKG
jgi:hypothetical protein